MARPEKDFPCDCAMGACGTGWKGKSFCTAPLTERAPTSGIPPLLEKLMTAYTRHHLAPGYLPKGEHPGNDKEDIP